MSDVLHTLQEIGDMVGLLNDGLATLMKDVIDIQATLFPLNLNSYTADDEGKQVEVTLDGFTRMDIIVRANFPMLGEVFAPECILLRQTALESMREVMHHMTLQQDSLQAMIEGDDEVIKCDIGDCENEGEGFPCGDYGINGCVICYTSYSNGEFEADYKHPNEGRDD